MATKDEQMPSEERLRELLFGKAVVSAEIRDESPGGYEVGPTGVLTLSDGTVLKVWGNDGCSGCSAGCYPLTELNGSDGIITNVEVVEHPHDDGRCPDHPGWEDDGYYRIFVVAEDRKVTLASFDGSDGSGYYGTGWWLRVESDD